MFAGLISIEKPIAAWGDPDKILAALAPYSLDKPRDYWSTDCQMLLQVATRTGSTNADIYRHSASGIAVAFWGRLDNRTELIHQLEAEHKATNDELIALAWLMWGEHCPEKLIGDFAFAIASPKTGVVFLARDVMGVKPLFYRLDEHGVFFANSAAAFKSLDLGSMTPCREWTAKFMLSESWDNEKTAYVEVKKLPSAHSLLINSNLILKLKRYHTFDSISQQESVRNSVWLNKYKDAWQEAIRCRIPEHGPFGTENSGGLDSGSITAEIAHQLPIEDRSRLYCFGFCKDAEEPEYIMETAMKFGLINNHLNSGSYENICEQAQRRAIDVLGYPQEFSVASHMAPFYRECRNRGINVLFSGFGGDEVCTSNAYKARIELYKNRQWRLLWRILPGVWPLRLGRLAKTMWHAYRPVEHHPLMLAAFSQAWNYQFLRAEATEEFNLKEFYLDGARNAEDTCTVNEQAIKLLSLPYVSARLENCTLIAASYGIDYVWPFLDQQLVQQWLSSPTAWKVGDSGVWRYLHRAAVVGVCPDKIIWKKIKDMGGSVSPLASNFKDDLESLLLLLNNLPSELKEIIDVDKAKRLSMEGIKNGWEIEMNKASVIADSGYNLKLLEIWKKL